MKAAWLALVAATAGLARSEGICDHVDRGTVQEKVYEHLGERTFAPPIDPRVDELVAGYLNGDYAERDLRLRELAAFDGMLMEKVCDPDPRVRAVALSVLRDTKQDGAIPYVVELLRHETHVPVIVEALFYMSARKSPAAVPIFGELVTCDVYEVRRIALSLAAQVPDPALVQPLVDAWQRCDDINERASIVGALMVMKDRRALPIAIEAIGNGNGPFLAAAVGRKEDFPEVVDACYCSYDGWSEHIRRGGVQTIRAMGGEEALPFLDWAYDREPVENVRQQIALEALLARLPVEYQSLDRSAPAPPRAVVAELMDPCTARYFVAASLMGNRLVPVLSAIERSFAALPGRERIASYRRLMALMAPEATAWVPMLWSIADAAVEKDVGDYGLAVASLEEVRYESHVRGWTNEVERARRRMEELRLAWQQASGVGAVSVEVMMASAVELRVRIVNAGSVSISLPALDGAGRLLAFADVFDGDDVPATPLSDAGRTLARPVLIPAGESVEARLRPAEGEGIRGFGHGPLQVRLLSYPGEDRAPWVGSATSPRVGPTGAAR